MANPLSGGFNDTQPAQQLGDAEHGASHSDLSSLSLDTPSYAGDPSLAPNVPGDRHLDLVKRAVRERFLAEGLNFTDNQITSFASQLLSNPDVAAMSDDALIKYDQAVANSTSSTPVKATLGQLPSLVNMVLKSQSQDEGLNQLGMQTVQGLGGHLTTAQRNLARYGPGGKPQSMVDPLRDYEISQGIDPNLNSVYPGPVSMFTQLLGRKPKATELADVLAHGKDPAQQENYIRSFESHIKGMSIGTYSDLKSVFDPATMDVFGHTAADSLILDGYNEGITTKADVTNWLTAMSMRPVRDIPADVYASAYKAAIPHAAGLFNNVPDPRDVAAMIASSGQVESAPPATQKAEASAPDPTTDTAANPMGDAPRYPGGQFKPTNVPDVPAPPGQKNSSGDLVPGTSGTYLS